MNRYNELLQKYCKETGCEKIIIEYNPEEEVNEGFAYHIFQALVNKEKTIKIQKT